MAEELKTCPFCGGEAIIYFDTEATKDTEGRLWAYQVICDRCCTTTGLCWSTEQAVEALEQED